MEYNTWGVMCIQAWKVVMLQALDCDVAVDVILDKVLFFYPPEGRRLSWPECGLCTGLGGSSIASSQVGRGCGDGWWFRRPDSQSVVAAQWRRLITTSSSQLRTNRTSKSCASTCAHLRRSLRSRYNYQSTVTFLLVKVKTVGYTL